MIILERCWGQGTRDKGQGTRDKTRGLLADAAYRATLSARTGFDDQKMPRNAVGNPAIRRDI
ncbi:hypothetical protein [Noviherbaspirillum suwonense]|uniref:hypothetical protein n=1 Tax=Noviherbaspirillum suwonense TaxID=1224511 RepID=UPI0024B67C83|nr:hypothetical protein [Noviherbaspirillum suwonense]